MFMVGFCLLMFLLTYLFLTTWPMGYHDMSLCKERIMRSVRRL
jgi:hypothetical protein